MTKVTNLDPRSFGNFTYTSNFVVSNPDGTYKASFAQLKDLVGMTYEGAMFTQPNTEAVAFGITRMFTNASSVLFDTGSFTDSNSVGAFYINQTPKFSHIQIGFEIYLKGAQEKRAYIVSSAGGGSGASPALGAPNHVTEGVSNMMMQGVGAPVPVSSGDSFCLLIESTGTDNMVPATKSGACHFWIRGLGRA